MSKREAIFLAAAFLLAAGGARSNNLSVTHTALMAPAAGKVGVRFDISWENSWKDGVNWDAAWVFVKYSTDSGATWSHADLAASGTNPVGVTGGAGAKLDIVVPADKKGAFIQRSVAGTGTVSNTGVALGLDVATNGVPLSKDASVKVFAVEMVYVPEGPFYLGSGGDEAGHFYQPDGTAQTTKPYRVLSETNAISVGSSNGHLYYANVGGKVGDGAGIISNAFPKGYGAFYLMKTELSQRQYCDFINTLTTNQQAHRIDAGLPYIDCFRNCTKRTGGSPAVFGCDANKNAGSKTNADIALLNQPDDGEWVACNFIASTDGAAYADWAALRPMTELEFEKACRGPLAPVANECAWGNATLALPATTSLLATNTAAERPNQGNCNYDACSPDGPYRCGSYAAANSARTNSGASYYGVLDLSGSLWERPVTIGDPAGRGFTGLHGDGHLTAKGNANVTNWPGLQGGEVVVGSGVGFRGGSWRHESSSARVSDRSGAAHGYSAREYAFFGWRGARTAP